MMMTNPTIVWDDIGKCLNHHAFWGMPMHACMYTKFTFWIMKSCHRKVEERKSKSIFCKVSYLNTIYGQAIIIKILSLNEK